MTNSFDKSSSVARRAVNKVKETPQKIIEHALNTAIDTVEKAAKTDVVRATKRVEKTTKKLQKLQKAAKAAKSEAKRANSISSELETHQVSSSAKKKTNLKDKINQKIREITDTTKETSFYYDHRQIIVLTAIYSLLAVFIYVISTFLLYVHLFDNWFLLVMLIITQILSLLALSSVIFVLWFPQKLAVVSKEGIKIDHNQLLKWADIEVAEEKYTSYISRRPLIALHLKNGALEHYKLTFMQKLCRFNVFTPFSIPMYAMRPVDAANIRELIKKHVAYKDNRD